MRFINNCQELPENSRIRIYGSGAKGQDFMDAVLRERPDVTVAGFLDSFKTGTVKGLPQTVFDGPPDDPDELIVVCSCYFQAIAETMLDQGVEKFVVLQDEKTHTILTLDILNTCNAECVFCSGRKNQDGGEKFSWTMKEFDAIEAYVREEDEICFCSAYGEPILNRDILPMLRRSKELGKKTSIYTNGSTITDSSFARSVLEQTDILYISFVSTRDDISRKYMGSVAGNRVYENMRRIADEDVIVRMNVLVMRDNLDHLSEMYQFFCDTNVNHATFTLMRHEGIAEIQDTVISEPTEAERACFEEQIAAIETLSRLEGNKTRFSISGNLMAVLHARDNKEPTVEIENTARTQGRTTRVCTLPWTHRNIYLNGQAVPCCVTAQAVGNAFGDEQCFGNDKHRALQQELLSGDLNAVCQRCSMYPLGPVEELENTLRGLGMYGEKGRPQDG